MRVPSIWCASVVVLSLFATTAGHEVARGADLGPVNDFLLSQKNPDSAKECTDAGGTVYTDSRGRPGCHPGSAVLHQHIVSESR
jgi:hypothetical protein